MNGEGVDIKGPGIVISEVERFDLFHHDNGDDDATIRRNENCNTPNRKNGYEYNLYVTMEIFRKSSMLKYSIMILAATIMTMTIIVMTMIMMIVVVFIFSGHCW